MNAIAPSFNQVRAQVSAIRQKSTNARFIGIRTLGQWVGETSKTDGDDTILIYPCQSPLAMRLAIQGANEDHAENHIYVFLTSLEESELGEDILMRLAKRKLFPIDPWEVVKSLFQAHAIDPRLRKERWIAEYLIDWNTPDGYITVSNGFLDAETVWNLLLERGIGISDIRPDLPALLEWTIDDANVARLKNASPTFQQAAINWLANIVGNTTKSILQSACQTSSNDVVALGLALEVLLHPKATGKLDKAIGKIEERYLQGESLTPNLGIEWRDAAQEVIQWRLSTRPQQRNQLLNRADEILQEVGAGKLTYLSESLPSGFNHRLELFGKALSSILKKPQVDRLKDLLELRSEIVKPTLAKTDIYRSRLNNLDMTIRLLKWLQIQESNLISPSQSLSDAINDYRKDQSFVDWARLALLSDEPLQALSTAYAELFDRVTQIREQQSKNFAYLFADWTGLGSSNNKILVVENVLRDIVAPIASRNHILVIVMDGMSMPVCWQLLENITNQGWSMLCTEGEMFPVMSALATVPSTTEISRTSLLTGRLRSGHAKDESSGFAFHPDLNAKSQKQKKQAPILFHKASLQGEEDTTLSQDVRQAIADPERLIVGVVVNAIDDRLAKGEQLYVDWTQQAIKILPTLLHEAKLAERIVILVSDHGHIIERGTKLISSTEGGERWRLDNGLPLEEEYKLSGSRVVVSGHKSLIAPWSEKIRYKPKKTGYHGGINPQEIITPIAVLSSGKSLPNGWIQSSSIFPTWWSI